MPIDQRPSEAHVCALLAEAGVPGEFRCAPIPGGRNNRVFRVDADGRLFLLKSYFVHADDRRDRLQAEFAFSRFAWESGIRAIPRPFAENRDAQLGLYEWIVGRPLSPDELCDEHVDAAVAFFLELNRHGDRPAARQLLNASEACFSIEEHLACITKRIERLQQFVQVDAIDNEAAVFFRDELSPRFVVELARVRTDRDPNSQPVSTFESRVAGCLSPSDFGFHNALLQNNGRLRFFDFEYAGWDDPAKTICDFFCQPKVPVPMIHLPRFLDAFGGEFEAPTALRGRVELLLPVYRLKWCAIMMNEFLPLGAQRRSFGGADPTEKRKAAQLEQVREFLRSV